MMSCLDCFQKLYAEPSPPPHRHILCNGLSEPLPGATCLSSSLHPVCLGPVIHPHTRTSLLELRSGWVQTPGWHLIVSSSRSGGWRVRGWVEMEREPREASMERNLGLLAPSHSQECSQTVLTSHPSPLQLRIHSPPYHGKGAEKSHGKHLNLWNLLALHFHMRTGAPPPTPYPLPGELYTTMGGSVL